MNNQIWEVRPSPVQGSRDLDIFQRGVPASAGKIARVFVREGNETAAKSNAHLIATAPELLESLKLLRARLTKFDTTGEAAKHPLLIRVDLAIAKAEGEAA